MKLTDVCDFQGGSQPPKSQWSDEYKEGYIRMLQIRDYTQKNSKIEYVKLTNSTKKCEEKDILIARYGASIGKILTGLSGAYNVAMMKVIIDENIVDRNFMYNFLKSDTFQNYIKNVGQRAAQAGFNKEELSRIKINLPTLKEQKNVAEKLDKVQEIINMRKKQIEELDKIIRSQFADMFGDIYENKNGYLIKELDYYTSMITYGLTIRPKFIEKGIDLISAREINKGIIDYDKAPQISEDDYNKLSEKSKPKKNEILFSKTGTIGLCTIIEDERPFAITQNVARIVPKDNINPIWLLYYLRTDEIQSYCKRQSKGNAVKDFQIQDMKRISILDCPINKQNEFAEIVKQIDKQKFEIQRNLKEMQKLQESLMSKYFG